MAGRVGPTANRDAGTSASAGDWTPDTILSELLRFILVNKNMMLSHFTCSGQAPVAGYCQYGYALPDSTKDGKLLEHVNDNYLLCCMELNGYAGGRHRLQETVSSPTEHLKENGLLATNFAHWLC
jgi:hypothetical protein